MTCKGRVRHWFTIWGTVGLRSPVCMACGTPNPRPLSDDEWAQLIGYRKMCGQPFVGGVEKAISDRVQRELLPDGP